MNRAHASGCRGRPPDYPAGPKTMSIAEFHQYRYLQVPEAPDWVRGIRLGQASRILVGEPWAAAGNTNAGWHPGFPTVH